MSDILPRPADTGLTLEAGEKLLAAARARHKALEEDDKMMEAGDICWTLVA